MSSIEADAQRATELDVAQGVALVALARLNIYRWRFDESRVLLDRALERSPNDSVVHHYSAMIDLLRNQPASAVRAARRALELDPRNPAPHGPLSMALRALGEVEAAAAVYQAMIDVAPTAATGYVGLARTLTAQGDDAKILQTLEVAEQFLEDVRSFRLDAALTYARVGAPDDAERLVAEFVRRNAGSHIDPGLAAMAALAFGDYDRAYAELRTAIATRTSGMDQVPLEQLRQNTWSDPVLDEPAWRELRAALAYMPR
jgi:predicted Zn-dependent protease